MPLGTVTATMNPQYDDPEPTRSWTAVAGTSGKNFFAAGSSLSDAVRMAAGGSSHAGGQMQAVLQAADGTYWLAPAPSAEPGRSELDTKFMRTYYGGQGSIRAERSHTDLRALVGIDAWIDLSNALTGTLQPIAKG